MLLLQIYDKEQYCLTKPLKKALLVENKSNSTYFAMVTLSRIIDEGVNLFGSTVKSIADTNTKISYDSIVAPVT